MKRRKSANNNGNYERSLESYLKDIGRYPLLSREEECALARRIRNGDEQALHELVRANLRFVVSVAKKYLGQGLSLEDLINEGNIGLMKAGRRFDERRGFKFISYAVWWVRQSILQALADQSRVVRLPQNRTVILHKVHRAFGRLQQSLGRRPRAEEIAAEAELRIEEVREALLVGQPEAYLDERVSADDDRTLADAIADEKESAETDRQLLDRSRFDDLQRALAQIPEREARILCLYYGIGQSRSMTLEEIGTEFGLTRERIRQLKERALGRLRQEEHADLLRVHHGSA
jgi:RNA polymerase primary sigma factor